MIISVILPVYNGEPTIKRAIRSVLKDLEREDELIICNDASTDDTLKRITEINDKRIVVINNKKNTGISGALNNALDASKGEIICRMDADDIWVQGRRNYVLFFFSNKANQKTVLFGSYHIFNERQKVKRKPTDRILKKPDVIQLLLYGDFLHPTMNILRSNMRDYNPDLCGIEDIFLYSSFLKSGLTLYKSENIFLEYYREDRKYNLKARYILQMRFSGKLRTMYSAWVVLSVQILFTLAFLFKSIGLYKKDSKLKT